MNPFGSTCAEFEASHRGTRGGAPMARAAYQGLYRGGIRVRAPYFEVPLPAVTREVREGSAEGDVVKFVLGLGASDEATLRRSDGGEVEQGSFGRAGAGGLETESVLISMLGASGRRTHTLCVSSQVGCAMGCTFCETAQMGLMRSLTPAEIVRQWFVARWVYGIAPKNVVFMGMGEPLDNLDNVLKAIEVLTDHNGPAVPMNKITVSTVGRLDGIARLAERVREHGWKRLNLAVSVNAPNDEVRSRIMPINRAMPMGALKEALLAFPLYGGAKLCIEYVLIPGVNDAREHADELAEWVSGLPCCVNLIPYNPRRNSPWPAPSEEAVYQFVEWLIARHVFVKRRRTKGRATMAACGQLGNEEIRKRRFVGTEGHRPREADGGGTGSNPSELTIDGAPAGRG